MNNHKKTLHKHKVSKAKEALQRARASRKSRKVFWVDGISQLVDDVNGDWLKKWTEEDTLGVR